MSKSVHPGIHSGESCDPYANQEFKQFLFFRKDWNQWDYPEPILVLLLFLPSRRELPLTELERLGIWAARRAREEAKKQYQMDRKKIDGHSRKN